MDGGDTQVVSHSQTAGVITFSISAHYQVILTHKVRVNVIPSAQTFLAP